MSQTNGFIPPGEKISIYLAAITRQAVKMLLTAHKKISKMDALAARMDMTENMLKDRLSGRTRWTAEDFLLFDQIFYELDPEYTYLFWVRNLHCNQSLSINGNGR